LKKYNHT